MVICLAYLCGLCAKDTKSDLFHMLKIIFILAGYLTHNPKFVVCLKDKCKFKAVNLTVCGDHHTCVKTLPNSIYACMYTCTYSYIWGKFLLPLN